jgi:hypothetical protein
MQQPFHIPNELERKHWTYFCNSTASNDSAWQAWHKPAGITFINITAMGGGGGGGGATGWVPGFARSGGGGGGSAALTNLFIPAIFVPDTLYIKVGRGGAGGAGAPSASAATAGTAGQASYVSLYAATSTGYTIAVANGGNGGAGATNVAGATIAGGAAGTAIAASTVPLTYTAVRTFNAGIAGTQSGPSAITNNCSHGTNGASRLNMAGMGGVWKSAVDSFQGQNGWGPAANLAGPHTTVAQSTPTPLVALTTYGLTSPTSLSGMTDMVNFIGWSAAAQPITASVHSSSPAWPNDPSGYGCGGAGGSVGFPGGSGSKGGDGLVIITCG